MSDQISAEELVADLTEIATVINGISKSRSALVLSSPIFTEAADMIQVLRNSGDKLAEAIRSGTGIDQALENWEAHRG